MRRMIVPLLVMALMLGPGCQRPAASPVEALAAAPTAIEATAVPTAAAPAATQRLEIAAAALTPRPP
ncbi:MAG: hypothetical protein IJI82_08795, partial [Clostridia bacterium]|nr:hypothetical protein [Clostridia bacterium]